MVLVGVFSFFYSLLILKWAYDDILTVSADGEKIFEDSEEGGTAARFMEVLSFFFYMIMVLGWTGYVHYIAGTVLTGLLYQLELGLLAGFFAVFLFARGQDRAVCLRFLDGAVFLISIFFSVTFILHCVDLLLQLLAGWV